MQRNQQTKCSPRGYKRAIALADFKKAAVLLLLFRHKLLGLRVEHRVRRVLLLAFEDAGQMAALHFIGAPPALPAQLMPLQLPGPAASSQGAPSSYHGQAYMSRYPASRK